jgi:hypothetical protein
MNILVRRNYRIILNLVVLLMNEYYEICGGEIIALNDEKINENTLLYV